MTKQKHNKDSIQGDDMKTMSDAPKDGTQIVLVPMHGKEVIGYWWAEGTSWNDDCTELVRTGVWLSVDENGEDDGWLEPGEVVGWQQKKTPPTVDS